MAGPVRVRFAPSPTGHLHVGGARTALFNWLHARRHGGAFILRIEDTDRSRSTEEHVTAILDALTWLGLDWDEGPPTPGYRQLERLDIYRAHAERLVAAGRAYYCGCTPAELDAGRAAAQARGETFRYSGRCRDRGLAAGALRLRVDAGGPTVVTDLIHGQVTFDAAQLDDWILVRTDGTPTYNFCVVVDDVTMGITHVIRGNDHLPNTPKQLACYDALGFAAPDFAHVSMILGSDRSRLSKRHGATAVQAYRAEGILPEAMVNYLARLGWAYGDQEVFSREELIARFDIGAVASAGAVFDPTKLQWLSHQHLRRLPARELAARAVPFLAATGALSVSSATSQAVSSATSQAVSSAAAWAPADLDHAARVVDALRERARTLVELAERARPFFVAPEAWEPEAAARWFTPEGAVRLGRLAERLEGVAEFTAPALETATRALAAELGVGLVALAQLARLAVTGGTASPPIFEVLALLGRPETLARIGRARARAAGQ